MIDNTDFDVMKVLQSCRCCLLRPPDKCLKTSYTHLGKTEIYLDMIRECFDINLTLGNDKCGICEVCVCRLRNASDFKQQVQRSQAKLLEALNAKDAEPIHIYIKSEKPDNESLPSGEASVKLERVDDKGLSDEESIPNGIDDRSPPTRKNRKYSAAALKTAIESVLHSNMTLYRASKEYKIPWTTLKANLERVKEKSGSSDAVTMSKIGRPYALPVDIEHQLVSYIIEIQKLGFSLTANKIRQLAYTLAESAGVKHKFNSVKNCAGWGWWVNFKERFGTSLRPPENLLVSRDICSNTILKDFYEKLGTVLVQHDLLDCPERIWNCDETGLIFVDKPDKVVTKIGKKFIYNRTYAKKGTTATVLPCINAAGGSIPPMVIFKGVRNIPELSKGNLPNSLTRMSPKGWIDASLFLDWLMFFATSIPPARPVILIMNSHANHVSPMVLAYARSEQIILVTMPAHISHIAQPLDVGVFRSLKAAWREELQFYKYNNPDSTPTKLDFHTFFTPAYEKSFTAPNIRAGFKIAGIYPFNKYAICLETIPTSKVIDKQPEQTTLQELVESGNVGSPQSEISELNDDPLRIAAAAGSESRETLNKSNVTSYNAHMRSKLQMDCDAYQGIVPSTTSPVHQHQHEGPIVSNAHIKTECASNSISSVPSSRSEGSTIMTNSQTNNKILEILELPKSTPTSSVGTEKIQMNLDVVGCSTALPSTSGSLYSSNSHVDISAPKSLKRVKSRKIWSPKRKKSTESAVNQKGASKTERALCNLKKGQKTDDDWICNSCGGDSDVTVNGTNWITCSFCMKPYHIHCQGQDIDKNQEVFMCDDCSVDPDDSDSEF